MQPPCSSMPRCPITCVSVQYGVRKATAHSSPGPLDGSLAILGALVGRPSRQLAYLWAGLVRRPYVQGAGPEPAARKVPPKRSIEIVLSGSLDTHQYIGACDQFCGRCSAREMYLPSRIQEEQWMDHSRERIAVDYPTSRTNTRNYKRTMAGSTFRSPPLLHLCTS